MERFPTYGNLVQNDNDLIGLIAYSLYKQDKLAFVAEHKKATTAEPNDGQMETFCRSSNLPNRIQAYRDAAAKTLETLNDQVLKEAVEGVEADYKEELQEQLEKLKKPTLGEEVLAHVLAGMIVWVLIAFLIFCALVARNGFGDTVRGLTGYEIQKPAKN